MASISVSGVGTTVDISASFTGNGTDDQAKTADALRQVIRYLERKLYVLVPEEPSVLTPAHETGRERSGREGIPAKEHDEGKGSEGKHEEKGHGKHKGEGEGRDE